MATLNRDIKLLQVTTVSITLCAFLIPYARHFRGKGWRVDALANDATESEAVMQAFDWVWDIEWSRNPLSWRNMTHAFRRVRRLVTENRYDLVHVHTPVAAFVTRLAVRTLPAALRPKVVYTAHGFHFHSQGNPLANWAYEALERLGSIGTDYQIVINQEDYERAMHLRLAPSGRVKHMPGIGLDMSRFNFDSETVGEVAIRRIYDELRLKDKDRLLLMVAEFIPRKRHADVLQAFVKLDRPDLHLAFAGKGLLMQQMQALAAELGVSERVHFLGQRSDVPTLMLSSAALLLPSTHEGLPQSILEAMSLGIPVIGSDIRGNRDLLQGGAGILVRLGDIDGLADAVRQITDDHDLASRISQTAMKRAKLYDIQHVLRLHEELYAEVLSS